MAFIKKLNTESVIHEDRQHPRNCPGLLAGLEALSARERRWAARDLVHCPDVASALIDRLKREDDLSVRAVILTTLTRLGNATAVAGLVDCLRSENAALRNEAIEAMKALPNEVGPIMQGLLGDTDPDVRIFAVNILESLRHPDVEHWLIDVIDTEPHVNVCATALDLLSEIGTDQALASLDRLKNRFADEPYIHFAAELALRRIHEG
jgi:HEAT repeat protein